MNPEKQKLCRTSLSQSEGKYSMFSIGHPGLTPTLAALASPFWFELPSSPCGPGCTKPYSPTAMSHETLTLQCPVAMANCPYAEGTPSAIYPKGISLSLLSTWNCLLSPFDLLCSPKMLRNLNREMDGNDQSSDLDHK